MSTKDDAADGQQYWSVDRTDDVIGVSVSDGGESTFVVLSLDEARAFGQRLIEEADRVIH